MSYLPGIPAASDKPSNSQSQIQANFTALNTIFGNNHVTFNASASGDRGKHSIVDFVASSVAPTTLTAELCLYNKNDGSSIPQLSFVRNGVSTAIQMTGVTPSIGANGYTSLTGLFGTPLTLQWGMGTVTTSTSTATVTFPTSFNSACYVVHTTPINFTLTRNACVASVGITSFIYNLGSATSSNINFYWVALGT